MDNSNQFKRCAVPLCSNTSSSTPGKIFIPVPSKIKRRNLWLRLAKRNPKDLTGNSKIYFCEDHFDLKTDMLNYFQHGMGLTTHIEMVPGCIPTKFKCQTSHKVAQSPRTAQVPNTEKNTLDLTEELMQQKKATPRTDDLKLTRNNSINVEEPKTHAESEKMEENRKVFSSDIKRSNPIQNNCLYDLIKIIPAHPVDVKVPKSDVTPCAFVPNTDKYYIPKKKPKLKVRTVRSIRKEIEQDIYNYLPKALEKQKATLLKKIMDGSAMSDATQSMAKSLLKSDVPVLRSSWQMLMNINPENNLHSKQFVLWNGKCIQVNGSKGGKSKFICNYDLGRPRLQNYLTNKNKLPNKEKGLLKSSLATKFKPGPLGKKKYLDDSYQKYHVGSTELVNLPKPGLDIQPFYGMALESGIAKFVNSLREENGIISSKWAEFAVAMLGSIKNSRLKKNNADEIITFDLNYKYDQHRIIMRRDLEHIEDKVLHEKYCGPHNALDDLNSATEIKDIVNKILDTVEISLEQDNMYSGEDETRVTTCEEPVSLNNHKDKLKRRYCELGRLDVTVIRLPENSQNDELQFCDKPFCTLGCVCSSLECSYKIKTHCGLTGCMFQCSCDFSRFMDSNILKSGCSDFIPGLVNLDTEMNLKLAKEEQRFRQTVIVSGENSIMLKRQKRNWKASKKYGDFYSNLNLKVSKKANLVLSVVNLNLNCKDIEPWCMVHNLYKCFCKGKFTEISVNDNNEDRTEPKLNDEAIPATTKSSQVNYNLDTSPSEEATNTTTIEINTTALNIDISNNYSSLDYPEEEEFCARVIEYQGRKYSNGYYQNTNIKIKEMEENDNKLKRRLMFLLNNNENISKSAVQKHAPHESLTVVDVEANTVEESKRPEPSPFEFDKPFISGGSKSKLVKWLESSYKIYKQRMSQGITKTNLEPPQLGKLTLYSWEFVLQRYKQRKNLFMVSTKPPFRIYIAVDGKSSFFKNCININHIELADLHKFPVTVKNLLTSACDSQDDFCILCGWNECWEIIGSVSKVDEKCETDLVNANVFTSKHVFSAKSNFPEMELFNYNANSSMNIQTPKTVNEQSNAESSKWFVMTVENDFSEIQFHTRGFFVTYSSIIKAINVARRTGKTVRLSSQKCADKGSGPQFGIYAIQDAKEYCVFVGPYEMHEPLGIETVKNILYARKDKKTRGVWITTDKLENKQVIDNPLSYIPFSHLDKNDMVDLDNNDSISIASPNLPGCSSNLLNTYRIRSNNKNFAISKIQSKPAKPIKIRKSQDFYHIASNGELKKIFFKTSRKRVRSDSPPSSLKVTSSTLDTSDASDVLMMSSSENMEEEYIDSDAGLNELTSPEKSVTEVPQQIKVNEDHSQKIEPIKTGGNMFILKPEEINKKLLQQKLDEPKSCIDSQDEVPIDNKAIDMDIENFLANSVACHFPDDEVLVVSDDTDDENCVETDEADLFKKVWIQCTNIENLGWISGRKDNQNLLSFEFPGFKPTEFYEIQEAFAKINQVLSRKVYIPKKVSLRWEVIESKTQLKCTGMLKEECLGPDFVLTKQGIRHKQDILNFKTYSTKKHAKSSSSDFKMSEQNAPSCSFTKDKISDMSDMEQ